MKIKLNSPHDPFIVVIVISKFFEISLLQIPKTVQLSTGKKSAKYNALNSHIECVLAVIFADPQWEGYKVYKSHSLLGSVLRQTSTFQPLPSIIFLESAKI